MLKKKPKKIVKNILFLFFLLIIVFLVFLLFKKSTINYKVNNWYITESYNQKENYYTWNFSNQEKTLNYFLNSSKKIKSKEIKSIEEHTLDDTTCLKVEGKTIRVPVLCLKDNTEISVNFINKSLKEELNITSSSSTEDTYNNTTIYNLDNHIYYLWNYKGFSVISANTKKEINLFNKETYTPKLITKINNKLIVPDLDSEYSFSKIYIIDMLTMRVNEWSIKEPIYFDSSILGTKDNDIYLIDKHEKKEWVLNIKKKTIKVVGTESKGGIIYQNGFNKVTMNKLLYQDNTFINDNLVTYNIQDNYIYKNFQSKQIKVLNNNDFKIISFYNDDIFYLNKDTLYHFDGTKETKVLTNFEWHFNNDNQIFITD